MRTVQEAERVHREQREDFKSYFLFFNLEIYVLYFLKKLFMFH